MGRKAQPLPADLAKARTVFDRWRKGRKTRTRVPDDLWETAVPLARKYSLHRVARALGLNYDSLKGRMAQAVDDRREAPTVPTFIEVSRPKVAEECVVELEERRGAKMTIRFSGSSALDIVGLASAFFRRRR
jgi:hypothetical protein